MKVRILSFLLTLCMILTLVPAVAFAETTEVKTEEASSTDAFKAAINGDAQIVKLTGDVEFVGTIARDVKIDLNGKKLSGTIITDGTVTVVDSGAGTIDANVVTGEGTLVIESAGKMDAKLVSFVSNTSKILSSDVSGFFKIAVATAAEIPYQVGDKTFVRWADAIKAGTVVNVIQNVTNFNEEVTASVEIVVADGVKFTAPVLNVATGVTVTFSAGKVAFNTLAGAGKVVAGKAVGANVVMDQATAPVGASAANFEIKGGLYKFDATAFLSDGLTQINNLIVNDVADYVAYVGVGGYTLSQLDIAVAQAAASGNPIILVTSLDRVITIPQGKAVTIELNGCTVTSVIQNEGTLVITDSLGSTVGIAEQIINNGNLTLKGGSITRVENHSAPSTTTLEGAKLGIFDNYSTADKSLLIKSGEVSANIANTYTEREWFYENAGLAAVVDGFAKVIKYAAFVGDTGYLSADVKTAIEAITGKATVTLYENVDTVTINGNVTFDIKVGELKNVTIAEGKTLTIPYANTEYTYGEGFYETIGKPVCYIVVNGESVYYTSLQAAIDAVVPGTKTTITLMDDVSGKFVEITEAIDVVIDFGDNTYYVNDLLGAHGTVALRIHNADAVVELKNGTFTLAETYVNYGSSGNNILVQNFGKSLTLTDMVITGDEKTTYVVSNNNGSVAIVDSVITATEGNVAVDAYYWPGYGGLTLGAIDLTITGDSVITGDIEVTTSTTEGNVTVELEGGVYDGAIKGNNLGGVSITGGTFTGLTYEEFYGYIGDNIANVGENGELSINNENVYVAKVNNIEYLTVDQAIAVAKATGLSVYLLADATIVIDATEGAKDYMIVADGYAINGITMNGTEKVSLTGGIVTGAIVVNAGTLTNYKWGSKTVYEEITITVADDAELSIVAGEWYVEAASVILPYVPTNYTVIDNDGYFTVSNADAYANPQVSVLKDGVEVFRIATLEEAIAAVLSDASAWYGCSIKTLVKFTYTVDLANGQNVVIDNAAEATINVQNVGDQLTEVVGNVYTGYTTEATVNDGTNTISYKCLADAVAAADGKGYEVTVITNGEFTVTDTVVIGGVTYGVGEYDDTTDFDATIGAVRYATLADAVAAAETGATITVVRDTADNNVEIAAGKTVTVIAGNINAKFNLANVTVTGTGKIVFQYANINKLTSTSGATVEASTLGYVAEIEWENGSIAVRGDAGTVAVKNATVKLSHSATIDEITLEGNITIQAVSNFTIKAITLNDVTFGEGSSIETGNFYGLTEETLAAINVIVKEGYVLNKAIDADEVVYHEVVNAADFVAIVDGYYFVDIYAAIEFAAGTAPVTLVKAVNVVLENNATVIVTADTVELLTIVTANSSYYLDIVETEATTTYTSKYIMAQVGDKYYASINDAIAAGNDTIQIFNVDTFTVESGFIKLYTSSKNVFTVYGAGTYTTFGDVTVTAQDASFLTYKFVDLQTAIDFAVANDLALTITAVTEDQAVTIAEGEFTFYFAIDSIVDLTITGGNVTLVSGRFSGDVDAASYEDAIATSVADDVTTVYSAVYEINADQPSNLEVYDDIYGLIITGETYLVADDVIALEALTVAEGATLTLDGAIDVITASLKVEGLLLIASVEVWFDSDVFTGNQKILAAIEGTEADMWLLATVDYFGETWYRLDEAAVGFNNKGYANLTDALAAAKKATGVITLYANQEFTKSQTLTNVVIDLNDFTLTVADIAVSGTVVISNGTVAVNLANSKQSYAIKANAKAVLELNNVTVQAGGYYDNYTGKKVAVQLESESTLQGTDITLAGINVFADPTKPAVLNVNGNVNFANAIFYKFSNKASLNCINHSMTDAHDCAYCGEKAVKIVLSTGATVVGAEADENGAYWFFDGEYITLKHGTVEAGKHFARWIVSGGASFINVDVDKNQLLVVAGETNYAFVSAEFDYNNEVTVQISAPYFNVTGLTSAQIGNVVITPSAGAKITVTYSDPTNGIFGDVLYWINDNGAIIGIGNVLEYTVPTNGGTITAICSSATAGQDITVVFQNGAAKIGTKVLNYAKYTTADLANLFVPALPALGAQKVLGWSIDGTTELVNPDGIIAAIEAAIAEGKTEIVFVPAIGESDSVNVTVKTEGAEDVTVEANPTVYTTITADLVKENGDVLSHWVVKSNVVGEEDVVVYADALVYKFTEDTTVEAVYVPADAEIERNPLVSLDWVVVDGKIIFEGVYQLPAEYTMTDAGIIYSTTESVDDSILPNTVGYKTKHVTGLAGKQNITYTLTVSFKSGVVKNTNAIAFVSCTDADGNVFVFYSDAVTAGIIES